MVKVHHVESKYKNPDKYIERLKNQIAWANNNWELLRRDFLREKEKFEKLQKELLGEHWFDYRSNNRPDFGVSLGTGADYLSNVNLEDNVIAKCKVIKIVKDSRKKEYICRFEVVSIYHKEKK